MHTKSISYLPLNFGFRILLIASIFYSCNSSTIKNPGLIISSNQEIPSGWLLEKSKNFSISKSKKAESFNKLFLSSKLSGEIQLSQTLSLDSGDYFLMAKYDVNVTQGEFFIKTDKTGIRIYSSESTCFRTVFTLPIKSEKKVKIQFGFVEGSIGDALIDTIMIYNVDYKYNSGNSNKNKINLIEQNLSLNLKQDQFLDENIDLFASSINAAFLSKDSLVKANFIAAYSSEVFNDAATKFLSEFIRDYKNTDAYCQKSSLSLDELLRLYKIPTRQLHWQKNCSGFHQFLEYWNAYDKRWVIIDPFYGIRYVDNNGDYLGFEEMERLVRKGEFSAANIKRMDFGKLYYSESELLAGWINADLAVHIINK